MITVQDLREKKNAEIAVPLSYTVFALIQTARLALENDNGGVTDETRVSSAAMVLELAESLAHVLGDGIEILDRQAKHGKRPERAAAVEAA